MALVGRTAARLRESGVRRGDRVGVRVASGSKELYVSILGILAAGAAYVPVDADDPDERARLVFGEARVRGVIGDGGVYAPVAQPHPSMTRRSAPCSRARHRTRARATIVVGAAAHRR